MLNKSPCYNLGRDKKLAIDRKLKVVLNYVHQVCTKGHQVPKIQNRV